MLLFLELTHHRLGQLYAAKFHWRKSKFPDNEPTKSIKIVWCPSHCNIKGNNKADKLAKEATQLAWNVPISTSRAFSLCQAKASAQTAWVFDWQKSPHKGRFMISNRIPPSPNPTKHFVTLKDQCEVSSHPVQCQTRHVYTRELWRQFFPEKRTNCKCGEDPQTCKHTTRECIQHKNNQDNLREQNHKPALPELLGTPKGISAWKFSPKTEKRPQLDQTKSAKNQTSSLSLLALRLKDHKKTGYGGPVLLVKTGLLYLPNNPSKCT